MRRYLFTSTLCENDRALFGHFCGHFLGHFWALFWDTFGHFFEALLGTIFGALFCGIFLALFGYFLIFLFLFFSFQEHQRSSNYSNKCVFLLNFDEFWSEFCGFPIGFGQERIPRMHRICTPSVKSDRSWAEFGVNSGIGFVNRKRVVKWKFVHPESDEEHFQSKLRSIQQR